MDRLKKVLTGDDQAETYIIAEIGQAHDGSLGSAHAYIDAVAEAGVNAVKFQTHIARAESTKHEKFRVNVFPQDKTRYDYWERMEFTPDQWRGLAEHARELGLDFLSTPFSPEAVDLLNKLDVPAWKIGSGDTANSALLDAIINTGKPVLLSTGMSSYEEIDLITDRLKLNNIDFALFQCTTSYPCKAEEVGYNVITEMKSRYHCTVGLSDHSGTPYPSLASLTYGARILEVHAVFSKRCFGPDTSSSLEIDKLAELVEGVRFIEKGIFNPVDKDKAANNRIDTKMLFSRSAFLTRKMNKGDMLDASCFSMKKPAGGLSLDEANQLIGKRILVDREYDDFIKVEDFK